MKRPLTKITQYSWLINELYSQAYEKQWVLKKNYESLKKKHKQGLKNINQQRCKNKDRKQHMSKMCLLVEKKQRN